MQFKFSGIIFFAVIFAVNLLGCGSIAPTQTSAIDERRGDAVSRLVLGRAQERWDALLTAEVNVAYQYISPGGRLLMSIEQYRPRVRTGFWRGAKADKAVCGAETCEVTVLVDLIVQGVKFTNPVNETWILDAGKWWFVYQG